MPRLYSATLILCLLAPAAAAQNGAGPVAGAHHLAQATGTPLVPALPPELPLPEDPLPSEAPDAWTPAPVAPVEPLVGVWPGVPVVSMDARHPILFELSASPAADTWWMRGSITGERRGEALEVSVSTTPEGNVAIELASPRPFVAGERVEAGLRKGTPLVSGALSAGGQSSVWIGPAMPTQGDAFRSRQVLDAGLGPDLAVAADFNQDGAPDLAVTEVMGEGRLHIFLNSGTGHLTHRWEQPTLDGEHPGRIAVGDWNQDGALDVAITAHESAAVAVFEGDGNGRLVEGQRWDLPAERPTGVDAADLDMDGQLDLVVSHSRTGQLTWVRPAMAKEAQVDAIPTLPGTRGIAAADLNQDGLLDVTAVSEDAHMIATLLADGRGGFREGRAMAVGQRPHTAIAADFDGDSHTDMAVVHEGSNDVGILLGLGDGGFAEPVFIPAGDRPAIPAAADLNGDGALDLAVPNLFSDDLSLLMGTGDGNFNTTRLQEAIDAGPVAAAASDFDLDGDVDLAVAHSVTDNVAILANGAAGEMDGAPKNLSQNIPNPFNPSTDISYTLPEPTHVVLTVFDTSGKVVAILVDAEEAAGSHTVPWDGTSDGGEKLPSGTYFYRLTTDYSVELRRMTLIR